MIQASMAKSGIKLSFTDFLIHAVAQALDKYRSLNASFVRSPYDDNCHRVVDGALAAEFMRTLTKQLESDEWILM